MCGGITIGAGAISCDSQQFLAGDNAATDRNLVAGPRFPRGDMRKLKEM